MERAMETMLSLSDLYSKHKERDKDKKVVKEMERLESEFATAIETAREYMESRRDDKSCVCSEILSINLENNLTISDQSETYQKQKVHEGSVENSELKIAASSLSTAENASQNMGNGTNKITTKSVQDSSYAEQSNTTSLEQDTEKRYAGPSFNKRDLCKCNKQSNPYESKGHAISPYRCLCSTIHRPRPLEAAEEGADPCLLG